MLVISPASSSGSVASNGANTSDGVGLEPRRNDNNNNDGDDNLQLRLRRLDDEIDGGTPTVRTTVTQN